MKQGVTAKGNTKWHLKIFPVYVSHILLPTHRSRTFSEQDATGKEQPEMLASL